MFDALQPSKPDPIFGLVEEYRSDPRPEKMSLLVGYYRNEKGETAPMEAVKQAQVQDLVEYLPILGEATYLERVGQLIFGDFWTGGCVHAQTLGGTGALRLVGDLLFLSGHKAIAIPNLTWANHTAIFLHAGLVVEKYPYFSEEKKALAFDELIEFLKTVSPHTPILFHAVCHNPTGCDPTHDQWEAIAELCAEKGLYPIFDVAYLGFKEGVEKDRKPLEIFLEKKLPLAVCFSASKTFSLYGQRVGALYFFNERNAKNLEGKLSAAIRANYSNPPRYGAALVSSILGDQSLKKLWEEELAKMRQRMEMMRQKLVTSLGEGWEFLEKGSGLFCFTGLSAEKVEELIKTRGIYLPKDGRINVTALTEHSLEKVVEAIKR